MSRRDFIAVAFMLAGIYIWVAYGVYAVASFVGTLSMIEAAGIFFLGYLFVFLVACGVIFWVGYAFIFHAPALACRLVPEDKGNEPAFPWKSPDVQAVAISILGLALGIRALAQLGSIGMQGIFLFRAAGSEHLDSTKNYLTREAISQSLCVTAGFVLFFKASALAALWRRSQKMRVSKNEEEDREDRL